MTSGKQARKRRREEAATQPSRPEARRVLPPSVAREARHDQRRGLRRGLAYWRSLTPRQRKEIQTEAEKQAAQIQEGKDTE